MSANQAEFPIATMARVLGVSESGYHAWRGRAPSARAVEDKMLLKRVRTVHASSRETYGAPRIHAELRATGHRHGRKRIARLMRAAALTGASRRRKGVTTTRRDQEARPAPDLVDRDFTAAAPNRLWVVDLTYVPTWSGMVFTAFVSDVFSRRIVGWRTAASMPTGLPLDALEMALWTRGQAGQEVRGLVHHSDAGSQYTSIRYATRLLDAGALASIGSVGDSYDNALAESVIGLYKTECVRHEGPWRGVDDLELATLGWVHWFNHTRLHSSIGHVPPIEYENAYYRHIDPQQQPLPGELSLH
jgi:putative transposase